MTNLDIDLIVQDIMEALKMQPSPLPIPARESGTLSSQHSFSLNRRIIAFADVREIPNTVGEMIILPNSIITPSAQDELRRRNIRLIRSDRNHPAGGEQNCWWWGIQPPTALSATQQAELQKHWRSTPILAETLPALLTDAQKHIAETKQSGMILTASPAAAMLQACRWDELRPMLGGERRYIAEDKAAADANLLILSPNRMAVKEMLEVVRQFFGDWRRI